MMLIPLKSLKYLEYFSRKTERRQFNLLLNTQLIIFLIHTIMIKLTGPTL